MYELPGMGPVALANLRRGYDLQTRSEAVPTFGASPPLIRTTIAMGRFN
jgi:hypothetical protein